MKVKLSTIFTIRTVRAKDHIISKKQLHRWVDKQIIEGRIEKTKMMTEVIHRINKESNEA